MYNDNQILGNTGSETCQLLTAGSLPSVAQQAGRTVPGWRTSV